MAAVTLEQLKVALHGRSELRKYPFPGQPELEVWVRLLSEKEQDGIRLRAQQKVTKDKASMAIDPEYFNRLIQRETVAAAFFQGLGDEDGPIYLFGEADAVAELDALVVTTLYELYVTHSNVMDPYAFCPEEEVDGLVEQLGKSATAVDGLSLFDRRTLMSFVVSMASRLRAKQASPNSSTG